MTVKTVYSPKRVNAYIAYAESSLWSSKLSAVNNTRDFSIDFCSIASKVVHIATSITQCFHVRQQELVVPPVVEYQEKYPSTLAFSKQTHGWNIAVPGGAIIRA